MCFLLRRRCIPAACGVRPWTSWTMWWSAAFFLSSALETGFYSQTWELVAWRISIPSSCQSITPSPRLTGRSGPCQHAHRLPTMLIYQVVFRENSFLSLVFPTGLRCRRLELHWIMPWRISPWFSIVHSYLLALSCLIVHSSSSASAFICFVKGEVRRVGQDQGLNVVNIPAILRNAVLSHFFQEFDLFIPPNWIQPRLS